jgi:hypothetical protein
MRNFRIVTCQRKDATMQTLEQLRHAITTAQAAKALNRKEQTLRKWACLENGPIRPVRIHGRLAWPLDEIAALLRGEGCK